MTVEERLTQLEEIIEILMDDPAVTHKITVAKLMANRNKNPTKIEIKANYQ
jgi:TusA-related sulfurtransferase